MTAIQFRRTSARFPFTCYPYGWFPVLYGDELPPGTVQTVSYFGQDLVLWRDERGSAHVSDPFCPHLGAHLGDGSVSGENLVCPFHAWEFDGSGACARIPYTDRPQRRARLCTYPVLERNGYVLFWYHPDGVAPTFDVPDIKEYVDTAYSGYLHRYRRQVGTIWQEIRENFFDVTHAGPVHGAPQAVSYDVFDHGDVLRVQVTNSARTPFGDKHDHIDSVFYGPGVSVLRLTGSIDACLITGSTPIDDDHLDLRVGLMLRKFDDDDTTAAVADLVVAGLVQLLEQDIAIWEKKAFISRPALIPEDGPIMQFRNWARRFYVDPCDESRHALPSGAVAARDPSFANREVVRTTEL
jgi:3-ketosteroid 9alpha-monooxygenase subunit A